MVLVLWRFLVSSWRLWEPQEKLGVHGSRPTVPEMENGTLSEHLCLGDSRGSNNLSECSNMD
jgi:hypothetical protein